MDERRVRIQIVSRMTDEDGAVRETKHARHGTLCEDGGGVTLHYEETQDGERARVTLSAWDGGARMTRRGTMDAEMAFAPGERREGAYATPYGEIPVATDTRRVALARGERGGELRLEYDLYAGGERASSAVILVRWRL